MLYGIGGVSDFLMVCYWLECVLEKGYFEVMYYAGEVWIDCGVYGKVIVYIWLFFLVFMGYEFVKNLCDLVGGKFGVELIVGL